jgi:hypothetical protein
MKHLSMVSGGLGFVHERESAKPKLVLTGSMADWGIFYTQPARLMKHLCWEMWAQGPLALSLAPMSPFGLKHVFIFNFLTWESIANPVEKAILNISSERNCGTTSLESKEIPSVEIKNVHPTETFQ